MKYFKYKTAVTKMGIQEKERECLTFFTVLNTKLIYSQI